MAIDDNKTTRQSGTTACAPKSAIQQSAIRNPQSAFLNILGGILAFIFVGMSGNMLGVIEWLNANGVDMKGVGETLSLDRFLNEATVTNKWYIETGAPWGWMWRRPSTV